MHSECLCGRVGDRGGNNAPWVSRDYDEWNPSCAVSYCPCNRNNKCQMPSGINIRADGRCQKAVDFSK
jgi:hypothetical protein